MNTITRKIQVVIAEDDKEMKKQYLHTIYLWRDLCRQTANIIVSHKFTQENIRQFVYIKDEIKDKFYIKDILKEGKGMSEQNTTYRVASEICKGKMPADIFASLNQLVASSYKATEKDVNRGTATVRSYKKNIPIPFSAKAIDNIHEKQEEKTFYFTLFGIPLKIVLGKDRSNNKVIIERCIDGVYKICGSSLQIDDEKKKVFLLLTVQMPTKEVKLDKEKTLYAVLGVDTPIMCCTSENIVLLAQKASMREHYTEIRQLAWQMDKLDPVVGRKVYDLLDEITDDNGKKTRSRNKLIRVGNRDEFLHRRLKIQRALWQCQKDCKYSKGGKGRNKKLKAIDRFHQAEYNYIQTKLHTYARQLVEVAVKNECATIKLCGQQEKENQAKKDAKQGEVFLLRNWTYYGLKEKIKYKASMCGVTVAENKLLTGIQAKKKLEEILKSHDENGKYLHETGAAGYFKKNGECTTAFDNTMGDCIVQEFSCMDEAIEWLHDRGIG